MFRMLNHYLMSVTMSSAEGKTPIELFQFFPDFK